MTDGPDPIAVRTLLREPMTLVTGCAAATGSAALYSARAPGKETDNEDAALIARVGPDRAVLVVADGMGGHQGGARAAEMIIEQLSDRLRAAAREDDPQGLRLRGAVLDGIETAHAAIAQLGQGGGATVAVVEIEGRMLRTYHVGDCAVLVIGQRGKIRLETIAHAPTAYAVEAGLLAAEDAIHHADRHLVSNAVGLPGMRIEVGPPIETQLRDTVVIASDGLFDNLLVAEVAGLARTGAPDLALRRLVDRARSRMSTTAEPDAPSKPDDLTVVLYRPGDAPTADGPIVRISTAGGDRSP